MYSVVSSFAGDRHIYGCDFCGREDEGRPDEKNNQLIRMPIGWMLDCGPGRNPNTVVGVFCSTACRDENRVSLGILPRRQLLDAQAAEKKTEEVTLDPFGGPRRASYVGSEPVAVATQAAQRKVH